MEDKPLDIHQIVVIMTKKDELRTIAAFVPDDGARTRLLALLGAVIEGKPVPTQRLAREVFGENLLALDRTIDAKGKLKGIMSDMGFEPPFLKGGGPRGRSVA